jgi:Ca2+:H+ antiporter
VSHLARAERIVLVGVVVTTTLAGLGRYGHWPSLLAFFFATVSLAGLAHIVSLGVEQVGHRLGHGIAGLMQASLGNLPELFLVIFALRKGEAVLAQSTVLGSIFSNALLVLGLVILVGTRVARDGIMRFHHRLPNDTATLLIVTTFIIVIVGLSLTTHDPASTHVSTVSTIAAIALLIVYMLWVIPYVRGDIAAAGEAEPVEHEEFRHVPLGVSVALLAFGGAGAAFDSEWFVTALAPTVDQLGISRAFAGLVIAAIAGNAVENITAVILASKGHADLAISVVKNSVGQMAAFMWPALVLISLPFASKLTFALPPVYIGALLVTALAMWQITGDGEAVAFEGFALVALYLTLAVVTLYE